MLQYKGSEAPTGKTVNVNLRSQIYKIVYKERLRDIIGNLLKIFKGHSKESTNEKQSFKILNKQNSIKFTAHNSFYLFC